MVMRRFAAMAVAVALTAGSTPALVLAQQPQQGQGQPDPQGRTPTGNGAIGGKATDEAKKPYSDYQVLLRDIRTGQVASTVNLDPQGLFSFQSLALNTKYLVELYHIQKNKIVCTEGPYQLSSAMITKMDVNINCGTNPALWWILAAGLGTATVTAIAVRSASK